MPLSALRIDLQLEFAQLCSSAGRNLCICARGDHGDHSITLGVLEVFGLEALQAFLDHVFGNGGCEWQPVLRVVKDAFRELDCQPLAGPCGISVAHVLERRLEVMGIQVTQIPRWQRGNGVPDDGVEASLAEVDQVECRSEPFARVGGGRYEPAHCGDSLGSERCGHQVAILARNLVEGLDVQGFKNTGQDIVRAVPQESGDRCLLYREALVRYCERSDLVIDTMVKQFGDKIRSHCLVPGTHVFLPVRPKRGDPDPSIQAVRAETRLLVFRSEQGHDDVAEVACAGGEHGGERILPIVAIGERMDGPEAFTDRSANLIPEDSPAKLRKFAGENEVDVERHLQQLPR